MPIAESSTSHKLAVMLAAASVATAVSAQTWTVHVIPGHVAPPGSSGETWDAAYDTVQEALDRAKQLAEAPLDQFGFSTDREIIIKLAEGVFRPELGSDIGSQTSILPTTSSITLDISGGFKLARIGGSLTEIGNDGTTTLSGDTLANDDPAIPESYDDNVPVMLIDINGDLTLARIDVARLTFTAGRGSVHVGRDDLDELSAAGLTILNNPRRSVGGRTNVTFANLSNLFIAENHSVGAAGGLSLVHIAMTSEQLEFMRNESTVGAGGLSTWRGLNELRECTFVENVCWGAGGFFSGYDAYLFECSFLDNECLGAQFDFNEGLGGGGASSAGSLLITECKFIGNKTAASGGGARARKYVGSGRCVFLGNHASINGGAISDHAIVWGSLFVGNSAGGFGGGVFERANFSIYGSTFVGNSASDGGAFALDKPVPLDRAYVLPYLLFVDNGREGPAIRVVNPRADDFIGRGAVIDTADLFSLDPELVSVLEGHVIAGEPVFVDSDGLDDDSSTLEDNDYRLAPFSVGIDVSSILAEGLDLAGSSRRIDGDSDGQIESDAGAYEYAGPLPGCPQDFDLDGQVGLGDFLTLLEWYNLGQQRGDIADDFGNPGPDGQVSFGDFVALLSFVGPC